jgi:glutathione-regulated potassium-efflux system ancillary protein KefG
MSERRILILFAHPALEKSRVNRELLAAARAVDRVTINDLYEAYPDFDVDVPREQALLAAHDVVVFHHPFYWYSTPALLKQWQDLVLRHGWAYGTEGTALRGKWLLPAVTTGGREAAYQQDGYNRFTVRQLLAPIEQTARLCGMVFLPPFVVHGTHRLTPDEVRAHARDYAAVLTALRDGSLDAAVLPELPRLNADLGRLLARHTGGR